MAYKINVFKRVIEIRLNGMLIENYDRNFLFERKPTNKCVRATNFEELWQACLTYQNKMNVSFKETKKGRVIYIYEWDWYTPIVIKEWKPKNFESLVIKTTYTPSQMSVKEVLESKEGELAIEYLVERGLTVIRNNL